MLPLNTLEIRGVFKLFLLPFKKSFLMGKMHQAPLSLTYSYTLQRPVKPYPNMAHAQRSPICVVSLMKLSLKGLKRQDLVRPKALVSNGTLRFTSLIHYPAQALLSPSLNFTFVLSSEPWHLATIYGLIIIQV